MSAADLVPCVPDDEGNIRPADLSQTEHREMARSFLDRFLTFVGQEDYKHAWCLAISATVGWHRPELYEASGYEDGLEDVAGFIVERRSHGTEDTATMSEVVTRIRQTLLDDPSSGASHAARRR